MAHKIVSGVALYALSLSNFNLSLSAASATTETVTKEDAIEFSSMSELASVSYEARAKGVKNGTFLGSALKLCPDLVTIPYDFDGYQEVAQCLYNTVAGYTLDIQAVSCDEMLVDITEVVNTCQVDPVDFSECLRNEIFEQVLA